MMQQEQVWDYRTMVSEPSAGMKCYFLFLLIVCVFSGIRIVKAWRAAPPFRRGEDATSVPVLLSLEASLHQWVTLTFLGWGIFATLKATDVCHHYLEQSRILTGGVLFVLIDLLTTLSLALFLALFLFLIRWHTISRIARLQRNTGVATTVRN
jgi:hypothetical protein